MLSSLSCPGICCSQFALIGLIEPIRCAVFDMHATWVHWYKMMHINLLRKVCIIHDSYIDLQLAVCQHLIKRGEKYKRKKKISKQGYSG